MGPTWEAAPMRKDWLALIALMAIALDGWAAESFRQRLDKANATLISGKIDEALSAYRDLQTEDPESETLYYNLGCAHYRQGKEAGDQKQAQDALVSLEEAKKNFEKVLNARDPEVRQNAAFQHANTVAQIALQSREAQKYEETVKAFEESVKEYESFLRQYPEHEGARAKLDYMRYVLKTMLQNPPPPQEQQGECNQNKDSGDDQNQKQKDQQNPNESGKPDEKKPEEQQAGKDEENKDEQSGETREAAELKDATEEPKEQQEQSQDEAKPDDKQNVEALLQSLEDTDHREQRDMLNQRKEIKMRKEWW